jgi:hypothetical protein
VNPHHRFAAAGSGGRVEVVSPDSHVAGKAALVNHPSERAEFSLRLIQRSRAHFSVVMESE